MEHNEITVRVDVKMDLKERRSEFAVYRHWTRTTLRIEAIKCFPCYVKVTFVHSVQPPPHMPAAAAANSVININLPGLTVNLATSRTKPHTYGLFWKNNRNRCCMYLAFDDAEQCARHHHWMQTSIRNLDLHRREIHETRRASRYSQQSGDGLFGSLTSSSTCGGGGRSVASSGFGLGGHFNETGNIPDLNEILGPLPAVPDSAVHWSRRISGVSGIYEEIMERSADEGGAMMMSPQSPLPARMDARSGGGGRKLSRASVASGIYEVMRPPMQSICESIPPSPPPLPPRSRTFTNQEIEFKRSYTNPDTDTFKHRGGVSGAILHQLHLRQNSGGGLAKPAAAVAAAAAAAGRNGDPDSLSNGIKLLSFSSPDLTKLSPAPKTPVALTLPTTTATTDSPSTATAPPSAVCLPPAAIEVLPPTQSMHNLCTSPALLTPSGRTPTTPLRNAFAFDHVRAHTTPNSPLTPTPLQPVGQLIDCASGYCSMAPIIVADDQRTPVKTVMKPVAITPVQPVLPSESVYMSLDSSKLYATGVWTAIDCVDGGRSDIITATTTNPPLQRSGSSDAENHHHHITAAAAASAAAVSKRNHRKLATTAAVTPPFKSPLRSSSTNHHNVAGHRPVSEQCLFTTPPPLLRKPPAQLRAGGGAATEPRHRHMRPLSIDDKVPSYLPNASFAYVNSAQRQLLPALPPKIHSQSAQKAPKKTPTKKSLVPPKPRARSEEPDVVATDTKAASAGGTSDKQYSISTKKPPTSTSLAPEEGDGHSGKRSRLKHRILRSGGARAKDAAAAAVVAASNSTPLLPSARFVDIGDENSAQDLAAAASTVAATAVTRTASGPSTTVEKASKVSELGTSLKRFASMPRFRRLNFSPLKLKFNSVLQR